MDELTGYFHAIPDPRTPDKKAKDYLSIEILPGGISVTWEVKTDWKHLSLKHQTTSSSCGAQSGAHGIEDFIGVPASATPPYHFRSNYPTPGMWIQDVGNVFQQPIMGTTSEMLCPSVYMTEDQMNAAPIPASLPYKISGYYLLSCGANIDMDAIAQALDMGHGIVFEINTNAQEWITVPIYQGAPTTFSHFVYAASSNFMMYNGEKAFVITDSCNAFSTILDKSGSPTGERILTESFLKERSYGVLALIAAPATPSSTPKPVHMFDTTKTYEYVSTVTETYDPEILALQQCLSYLGFLKSIFCIGYFGQNTKNAVINFQNANQAIILTPAELTMGTGVVSYHTLAYLNSLFGSSIPVK